MENHGSQGRMVGGFGRKSSGNVANGWNWVAGYFPVSSELRLFTSSAISLFLFFSVYFGRKTARVWCCKMLSEGGAPPSESSGEPWVELSQMRYSSFLLVWTVCDFLGLLSVPAGREVYEHRGRGSSFLNLYLDKTSSALSFSF